MPNPKITAQLAKGRTIINEMGSGALGNDQYLDAAARLADVFETLDRLLTADQNGR